MTLITDAEFITTVKKYFGEVEKSSTRCMQILHCSKLFDFLCANKGVFIGNSRYANFSNQVSLKLKDFVVVSRWARAREYFKTLFPDKHIAFVPVMFTWCKTEITDSTLSPHSDIDPLVEKFRREVSKLEKSGDIPALVLPSNISPPKKQEVIIDPTPVSATTQSKTASDSSLDYRQGIQSIVRGVVDILRRRESRNILAYSICDSIIYLTDKTDANDDDVRALVSRCEYLMRMRTLSRRLAIRIRANRVSFLLPRHMVAPLRKYADTARDSRVSPLATATPWHTPRSADSP